MDRKLITLDTKLPVRVMKVTNCDTCHRHDAIMVDVFTDGFITTLFYSPLIDQGVETRCNDCRHAANLKAQAEQWLLHPDFFKADFGDAPVAPDAEYIKRSYQGYWPAVGDYKFIEKAALLIWYDNGMINRQEPEAEKIDLLRRWMSGLDQDILAYIDDALSRLTEHQLNTVCCGQEHLADGLVTRDVDVFLNKICDEEYLNGSV